MHTTGICYINQKKTIKKSTKVSLAKTEKRKVSFEQNFILPIVWLKAIQVYLLKSLWKQLLLIDG